MTRAKLEEIKRKQKIKNRRYMIGAITEFIFKSILTVVTAGIMSLGFVYLLFIADVPESQDSIKKRTKYIERLEEERRMEERRNYEIREGNQFN